MADLTVQRNRQLATDLLKKGMMNGKTDEEIAISYLKYQRPTAKNISCAVINHMSARTGLAVKFLDYKDELWNRLWLLYCMYDYDSKAKNLGKIFEGFFSAYRARIIRPNSAGTTARVRPASYFLIYSIKSPLERCDLRCPVGSLSRLLHGSAAGLSHICVP